MLQNNTSNASGAIGRFRVKPTRRLLAEHHISNWSEIQRILNVRNRHRSGQLSWLLKKKRATFTCNLSIPSHNAEYIVTFTGYFSSDARTSFISSALHHHACGWSIISRLNSGQQYPSDFSLLRVTANASQVVDALHKHPLVKRVTPQKRFSRILAASEDRCVGGCETAGWKSRSTMKLPFQDDASVSYFI